MPPFGPIKRINLIRSLKELGWRGPFLGGQHQFMVKGGLRLTLPNPHQGDISRKLLAKILQQAGISRDEWESV